jgi:heme exporter protein CcmD
MDQYTPYVVAAYLLTAATIGGLVLWVMIDRRASRRALERAERAAERAREGGRAR